MSMMKLGYLAGVGFAMLTTAQAHGAQDKKWGYCSDGLAYSDAAKTVRKAQTDWLCKLPTAKDTGDAREQNTKRCHNGQLEECQLNAGGNAEKAPWGDFNVPRGAWYHIPGVNAAYPHVRCECGCFTGDIEVLTTYGYKDLETLAKTASLGNVRVAVSSNGLLEASERLTNKDFTVGPEENPLYQVEAENGKVVKLTDKHPVLVKDGNVKKMIQAKDLKIGDRIFDENNEEVSVTGIDLINLNSGKVMVYNLDTKGKTDADHVILANGLQMGDVHWQKKLSEQQNRINNFLD